MLNVVFLILSAMGTLGIYISVPTVSAWWILPVWLACYIGAVFCHCLLICVSSIFLSPSKPIRKPSRFCRFMIPFTLEWVLKLFRVRITIEGDEKIPDVPCVIVSNHLSNFDPLAMLVALRRRNLVYISKDANFRLPFVGNYINNAGFISIDRANGVRAKRSLELAAERMTEIGVDVGIYPEGTRSKTGKLLRFKSGAFYLAQMAHAPIVILTTTGTADVRRNFPLRKTSVELRIREVIDAETVASGTVEALCAYTEKVVEGALEKNLPSDGSAL